MDKRELLRLYSEFLEREGYLDSDWRDEEPYAIEEFLKKPDNPIEHKNKHT